MVKQKLLLLGMIVLVAGTSALLQPTPLRAQEDDISVPVSGMGTATLPEDAGTRQVSFEGTLDVRRFSARNDEVFVVGTLSGRFFDQPGDVLTTIIGEPVRVTLQRVEASCERLRLVLGPVNVDAPAVPERPRERFLLLDLDELHLELTADSDDTGFLRTVLCGIADITGGDVDLSRRDLPLSAERMARVLNQAIGLFR